MTLLYRRVVRATRSPQGTDGKEDAPPFRLVTVGAAVSRTVSAPLRAALVHVQFETIHPYLDGNGRIGRLLVALLLEHWGLLSRPLLYLSLFFKQRRAGTDLAE